MEAGATSATGGEAAFRVGTSGWQYRDWKGDFYPGDVPQRRFLEHYATRFAATEVNVSFHRLPSESMIRGWLERTPKHFRFCLKLSRLITHNKRLRRCADVLGNFLERVAPLSPRMGPVLAQLPPSLEFDFDAVDDFIGLWAASARIPLAIEPRHESWMRPEVGDWLAERAVIPVVADSGGRWPMARVAETGPVYLRYHGPEALYASGYSPQKMGHEARRIREWLSSGRSVWAFFNNTDVGDAWRDAERLARLVSRRIGDS